MVQWLKNWTKKEQIGKTSSKQRRKQKRLTITFKDNLALIKWKANKSGMQLSYIDRAQNNCYALVLAWNWTTYYTCRNQMLTFPSAGFSQYYFVVSAFSGVSKTHLQAHYRPPSNTATNMSLKILKIMSRH